MGIRIFVVAILLWSSSVSALRAETPDQVWSRFRERFPYHIQVVAVSPRERDGTRTLILSEPPPHVTLKALTTRYRQLRRPTVQTQRIGFDGWAKDVTAVIPAMTDADLRVLVQSLTRDLFGTSYKAAVWDFTSRQKVNSSLDLSVSACELRQWLGATTAEPPVATGFGTFAAWAIGLIALLVFLKTRRLKPALTVIACVAAGWWLNREGSPIPAAGRLQPLHGGRPAALTTLLKEVDPGVYLSDRPGFVVLVVPRDRPLNESAVALREFGLESDLILGAVGSPRAVAVVARERQIPLEDLPPLRVETMVQLGAATTKELAQSYERTRLFAGRFNRTQDWAPIYLSDELQDTEYGSLLNITDQMLKSWSQHGEVEYINFHYPKPAAFPFPVGLLEHVKARQVTFNWNTKGVGYVDSASGFDVLAFTRTGALPVDYLGETDNRLREAEDIGADYFARLSDPNLARVVQYAGLYQIWRQFGITGSYGWSRRPRRGADAIAPYARRVIEYLRTLDLPAAATASAVQHDRQLNESFAHLAKLQATLRNYLATSGQAGEADLVRAIVRPREFVGAGGTLTSGQRATLMLARAISDSAAVTLLTSPLTAVVMREYAAAEGGAEPALWIKTPSIVVSWTTGNRAGDMVGGHNLSSRISHFEASTAVAQGDVDVVRAGNSVTVRYNPADEGRIGATVRQFARSETGSAEDVARAIKTNMRSANVQPRSIEAALKLGGPAEANGATRGLTAAHAPRLITGNPWRSVPTIPPGHHTILAKLESPRIFPIVVERQGNRFVISRGGGGAIEAADAASAQDAVLSASIGQGGGRDVHLHFVGMEPEQARQFTQAVEFHAPDRTQLTLRTSVEAVGSESMVVLGDIRSGRWNWAKAEIAVDRSTIGSVKNAVDVELKVAEGSGASMRMKLRVVFDRAIEVTSELCERVAQVVQRWLNSIQHAGEQLDVILATRRLMDDLKAIDPSIMHVETRLSKEAREIIIVKAPATAELDAAGD
jgi:hypothetical protein